MAEPAPSQQTQQAIPDTTSSTVTVVSTDTQVCTALENILLRN